MLKLDLHVHMNEANDFEPLTIDIVERLIEVVAKKGLDGIAVADHEGYDPDYPYKVRDMVEKKFDNAILIIPACEREVGYNHEVELYLSHDKIFRFLAHPGDPYYPGPVPINNVQGIEIKNAMHFANEKVALRAAEEHGLLLLKNSDAHHIEDIGRYYNEITIEELLAHAITRV
ncbi:PHP domain-containing protein [Chloroflexota bacterium]